MAENNNLDNTQSQETTQQTETKQEQPQATQPKVETPASTTEPTIADLMKELAEVKVDNRRIKKANDSLASENASLRKQVNAKMTEEELRAQQKAEEDDELRKKIADLEKKIALSDATERYMSMKMPKELAEKLAQAELDGDMNTVTTSINSFVEAQKKEVAEKVTADLYAKMPIPKSGNGDGQIDYEKQYNEKLASGDIAGAISAQLMANAIVQN